MKKNLNSFNALKSLKVGEKVYKYFNIKEAENNGLKGVSKLPNSLKVLLENLLRNEDGVAVNKNQIIAIKDWLKNKISKTEIAFTPARVLMQDYTGIPAIADLAAMRDAVASKKKDPSKINPLSKFKQHTLNYRSTVSNNITGSVADLIYRYPFDENIVNWSTNPNSASLKVHDANPQNVKDYSITIADQDNFNYTTTMTEKTFYRLGIKGTDKLPNDNQTN